MLSREAADHVVYSWALQAYQGVPECGGPDTCKLSLISGCPMLSKCSSGAANPLPRAPPSKNNTWDWRPACLTSLSALGCQSAIWLVFELRPTTRNRDNFPLVAEDCRQDMQQRQPMARQPQGVPLSHLGQSCLGHYGLCLGKAGRMDPSLPGSFLGLVSEPAARSCGKSHEFGLPNHLLAAF